MDIDEILDQQVASFISAQMKRINMGTDELLFLSGLEETRLKSILGAYANPSILEHEIDSIARAIGIHPAILTQINNNIRQ